VVYSYKVNETRCVTAVFVASVGERLRKKGQTRVHTAVDPGMVVRKLLTAVYNAKRTEPLHETTRS
jgi:hypothetical protein